MGEIRFVGTGETRGYPYLVCKKECYYTCVQTIFFYEKTLSTATSYNKTSFGLGEKKGR